jgi:predicted dehydrogenase
MSLRVAIAGVSHWHAARYIAALGAAGATVIAVSDHDPQRAAQFAAALGCRSYADAAAMFDADRPDLVVAMPRPCDGAALVKDLLDRRLPAIVEKPVTRTALELAGLAERAEREEAYLAVPFVGRMSPVWEALEDAGAVRHAHIRLINGPPERYADAGCPWMLDPALAGGGALRNLGIHAADALLRIAGPPLTIVAARIRHGAHPIDDYAIALLEASSGAQLILEAGYTFPLAAAGMSRGGDTCWRVTTQHAYITDDEATLTIVRAAGETTLPSLTSAERYAAFVHDAIARLRRGDPPRATLAECRAAQHLVDSIYAAAGS